MTGLKFLTKVGNVWVRYTIKYRQCIIYYILCIVYLLPVNYLKTYKHIHIENVSCTVNQHPLQVFKLINSIEYYLKVRFNLLPENRGFDQKLDLALSKIQHLSSQLLWYMCLVPEENLTLGWFYLVCPTSSKRQRMCSYSKRGFWLV